jgi:ribonuclease HI
VSHQHLGSETKYNVFTAELTALCLAAQMLQDSQEYLTCHIYVDSQAGVRAIDKPQRQSGQAVIKEFHDRVEEIMKERPTLQITIIWIPGHQDIAGNEQADEEAKRSAKDPSLSKPFNHKTLKSSRIRSIKELAKTQWHKVWTENTKTATSLRRIMKAKDTESGTKLYNEIPDRSSAARIAQLRTGHCGLNHYLHRFGLRNSPYCECGNGKETVEHYLTECRKYKAQRKELRKELKPGMMRTDKLLGCPKIIKHTIKYIKETKRFET